MRRYTKSIDVDNIEKIDNQENENTNIKINETIGYENNPSLPTLNTLDNEKEKENKKLENDNLMNISNLEKKNDDDDDEDEYFKQPLMRVHRISIHSKDLGKLRRKLSINNEKEKEREVSIDKELALKAALNYFGKRLKSFHGGRLNSERNRRNNSQSDYFNKNKNKDFIQNLESNRTRPNLKIYKDTNENEEIKNKDKEENDNNKRNEEKRNEKNEDNKFDEDNIYNMKYRVMVNRKKYREKNNISHEDKNEDSIDYHKKKNKQNDDEEKEYLNFTEKKNYNNIGRRKFIMNNSTRNKNEENEEIKNIISQRGKQKIIYKKKDISKYNKEKEKEKENKQNIKEILNENNSQNPIRVRRYQKFVVENGIDNNKNNEKRKEREVKKDSRRNIEKLIQTPEKSGHSFYRRYRINNDNKEKEKENIHNTSYKANQGLFSPNYSNSMIKNPIKLPNKVTSQIPLHKININNNNSHRSRIISETPKEKESISYTGYIRKIINDKKDLGSKEKDNRRIGVNKREPLQININYSNSFIGNYANKRDEKPLDNKYNRYNESSKDKKYEINHSTNYINTEGAIRINRRNNIFDKKQNYNIKYDFKNDYKNVHKNINQNINQNSNKNVAKYVDRRSKNNNNNTNLNNGYSTITASTVNRRRILIGKK